MTSRFSPRMIPLAATAAFALADLLFVASGPFVLIWLGILAFSLLALARWARGLRCEACGAREQRRYRLTWADGRTERLCADCAAPRLLRES